MDPPAGIAVRCQEIDSLSYQPVNVFLIASENSSPSSPPLGGDHPDDAIVEHSTHSAHVTAVLVSLFATIDLILNTAEGARLHGELAGDSSSWRWISCSRENLGRRSTTPVLRAGVCEFPWKSADHAGPRLVCHNELVEAMGHGSIYEVKVTRTQRFFANSGTSHHGKIRINQGIIRQPDHIGHALMGSAAVFTDARLNEGSAEAALQVAKQSSTRQK